MNTILSGPGRMKYHTDLGLLFEALDGLQKNYNWLITDLEANLIPPELQGDGPIWISGENLTALVTAYDIQFIWAVLSGFRPDAQLDLKNLAILPFADGNASFWANDFAIQHPQAEIEIVCFDSSSTFILSRDNQINEKIRAFFPEASDLNDHHNPKLL